MRAGGVVWRVARRLALPGALVAALAVPAPAASRDAGCGPMQVVTRPGVVVYRLPHSFLRAGTDSVQVRGAPWRPGEDYVIDRLRGELRLLRETAPGETLVVSACWLLAPPPLESRLMRYRPPAEAAADSAVPAEPALPPRPGLGRELSAAPAGASLTVSGSKTLAVDFGSNQDAFLRQSLDLAIRGAPAPGVRLTAALSDRNTPLTAAGTTQDLQALDRVLVELESPRGKASLGDLTLAVSQGAFGRLERRLQGAQGRWTTGATTVDFAAAGSPGEFHRLQFFGTDGLQGPYLLTDRDGRTGVSVVAGSEVVTLDGERLTRGEAADYSMDYDAARLTFTSRRPIASNSRVTIEYQYTTNRYRRNLVAGGARWERPGAHGWLRAVTETDDRGRPLDLTFDEQSVATLALAGDSASRAVDSAVTGDGGDYDTLRVAPDRVVFTYAGPGAGRFSVPFVRVGAGLGDYLPYAVAAGTAFRWVGDGLGDHRVGRALPLPESHQLWTAGAGGRVGVASFEAEGAMSRIDRNTYSDLDDADNVGAAGRARLALEGRAGPPAIESLGFTVEAREVARRFAPFSPLEEPFAGEAWGLPTGVSIDRSRRVESVLWGRAKGAGELRVGAGLISTPGGIEARRREARWTREGALRSRAVWEWAESESDSASVRGGRERLSLDVRWRTPWLEPAVRAESDERRAPGDSASGFRNRGGGFELASGRLAPVRTAIGWDVRRDGELAGGSFVDRSETRVVRLSLETPEARSVGGALRYQRRSVEPLAEPRRTRSDLASVRLRAEDRARGLGAQLGAEITSEAESRRVRQVTYVGPGGAYDSLGNFVGTGDYALAIVLSPELERVSRASTTLRLGWQFGNGEAWRGSRFEFAFESEVRRRGELEARDPMPSPGAARSDPAMARAGVTQRGELELAPGSRAAAIRLRAERRVTADRSYSNFEQTIDDRSVSARWRARPGRGVSAEVEGRWRDQEARQALTGIGALSRRILERGGLAQVAFTPDARLRMAGVAEATWAKPSSEAAATRTLRLGPDLGLAIGARAHVDLSARRAFLSGPPAYGLLPSADPAGAPTWEANGRFDYRVLESTTAGLSVAAVERVGRPTQVTGRAEVRAYF